MASGRWLIQSTTENTTIPRLPPFHTDRMVDLIAMRAVLVICSRIAHANLTRHVCHRFPLSSPIVLVCGLSLASDLVTNERSTTRAYSPAESTIAKH